MNNLSSIDKIRLTLDSIFIEAEDTDIEISKIPLNEVINSIISILRNETELYRNELFSKFVYECYNQGFVDTQEVVDFDVTKDMTISDENTNQIFFEISKDEFYQVLELKGFLIQKDSNEDLQKLISENLEEAEQQVKDWLASILDKLRTIADNIS